MVLSLNFDTLRSLFGGHLTPAQVSRINAITDAFNRLGEGLKHRAM